MSIPAPPPTGRIESLHFARLLAHFWAQGFSGSFRAQGHAGHALTVSKEILFERGRIAWAASDDPQESIKTHLLNRGILRPEQWRLAQEKAGSAHPRQTLLDLGFLTSRELQDADRERVSGIILSLFNWAEGEYATSQAPLPPGTPNLKIDPRDLVLEGIMSSGDRDRVLAEIDSLDSILVVRPDDLVRASLSLPVELVELMGKADGTRSVAEICALSPLSDFMISAAFAALKILGLATPAEKGADAVPPAPPRVAPGPSPARRSRRAEPSVQLPLMAGGDPSAEGAATMPLEATPSEGTSVPAHDHNPRDGLAVPQESEASRDSGTRPMVATPPGGTPAVIDDREEHHQDLEDDSGTRPMVQTPDEGLPAVESHAGAGPEPEKESPEEMAPREGETELTPGIPLPSLSEGGDGLRSEEIESVVDLFGSPAENEPLAPQPTESAGSHDMESHEMEDDGEMTRDESPPPVDPAMEEAPTWIYEPSAGAPPAPRRSRLVTWGGIAAGVFAIGTVLTIVMGGAGDEAGPAETDTAAAAADLPAVEVPQAPAGGAKTPPVSPEAAKPPPAAKAPPVARATSEPPAPLASPRGGDILENGSFRDARGLMAKGRLTEAARGFQSGLRGKSGLYTVQLALACRPETVTRALKSTGGAEEFFILPKEFNGRACYRLLWGAFQGRKAAERGQSSVPRSFLKDRNPPFVAPI